MDYEHSNMTPRDRIDDELRRVISEELRDNTDCARCGHGNSGAAASADEEAFPSRRGCRGTDSSTPSSRCGCRHAQNENRTPHCECESARRGVRNGSEQNDRMKRSISCTRTARDDSDGHETFTPPKLTGVPLSMVYSPYQEWDNMYDEEDGFERGTVFRDLDFPFYPTPCNNRNCTCRGRSGL